MSFLRALQRDFLDAARSHRFQINRRGQRNQSFIRANIRSRFLSTNMLFARGERQHKTASSFLIVSFANQTAGNLSRVFVARREQPNVWSTERQRDTERLAFSHDDVGAARAG